MNALNEAFRQEGLIQFIVNFLHDIYAQVTLEYC